MSSPSNSPLMTPETLNETITLHVGRKRKKYIVHKKILCDQSEFFNAALNKNFKEAADGEMYLSEDDPTVVADLIEYLYRGKLPSGTNSIALCRLYYLAEKICMPSLMDYTMDGIIESLTSRKASGFSARKCIEIYENTHHNSKLRLYTATMVAFRISGMKGETVWLERKLELFNDCPSIFKDIFSVLCTHGTVACANREGYLSDAKKTFGKCGFHVHNPDGTCYTKVDESKKGEREQ